MTNFCHLILTKFNVRSFPDLKPGCDPTWLERRFNLFDQYCFPSVYHQSNQSFKWLIFFDIDTPTLFKKRIEAYAAKWNNFVVRRLTLFLVINFVMVNFTLILKLPITLLAWLKSTILNPLIPACVDPIKSFITSAPQLKKFYVNLPGSRLSMALTI